jgi:[glutamine synthetase] adenylyltransferase / [glutamine synthetase]-adenylyl-L-tyrosine phosphorylase
VEFSVQALQLRHAKNTPQLRKTNTLGALRVIAEQKFLPVEKCKILEEGYTFLRRVENKLHLYDNRQTFLIPGEQRGLRRLAKSLRFSDRGSTTAQEQFEAAIQKTMSGCRDIFEEVFF